MRATGVNAIATEAGVTKMTLYAHFDTKEDLVAEYLRHRDRTWGQTLDEHLSAAADATSRLLSAFDAYAAALEGDDFRQCPFVSCAAEFSADPLLGRQLAREHKAHLREILVVLAEQAGCEDARSMGGTLLILLEGAFVTGAIWRDPSELIRAREVARQLVEGSRDASWRDPTP